MNQRQVEARVLDIVETVVQGNRVEDDRVDCKAAWPSDMRRAARQIAGLANAAAGETVMWIVGLDEDGSAVVNPGTDDPASWWGQVERWFAEVAPDPMFLRVPTPYGPVIAVALDTGRSPYLVTTHGIGGVDREVPWRSATGTRSAHRSEILRSILAEAHTPTMEGISAWFRFEYGVPHQWNSPTLSEEVRVSYAITAFLETVTAVRLPEHRWHMELSTGRTALQLKPSTIEGPFHFVSDGDGRSTRTSVGSISYVRESALHVNGSDRVSISGSETWEDRNETIANAIRSAQRLNVALRFPIAISTRSVAMDLRLSRVRKTPMVTFAGPDTLDLRIGDFLLNSASVTDTYYGHRDPSNPK